MNYFANFPKRLRIGPMEWKIEIKDSIEGEWGNCRIDQLVIQLGNDHPSFTHALQTVLHELQHAVFAVGHFEKGDNEERICALGSAIWTQIYIDNPMLLKWICAAVKK